MICDLEARIDELEQQLLDGGQKKGDQATSPSCRVNVELPATPPKTFKEAVSGDCPQSQISGDVVIQNDIPKIPSRSLLRRSSFLRDCKRSTAALRSLYSSANPSFASLKRPSSIFSNAEFDEEMERQMLNSPRLSILSESGFSSIYGHVREQTPSPLQSESPDAASKNLSSSPAQRVAQREARIRGWVEESNRQERPKTPVQRSMHPTASGQFSSINQVIEKAPSDTLQPPPRSPSSPSSRSSYAQQRSEKTLREQCSPTKSLRQSARAHNKLALGTGPVFSSNHLPPTPDTMSTATIEANSSMQSIITEKSLADGAAAPPHGYAAFVQDRPSRNKIAFGNEIIVNNDTTSDDDIESTQVQRSNVGSRGADIGYAESPLHMGASMKATHFFGSDIPARPALTTSTTDFMFNGKGFSPKQPSQGLSYPSPKSSSRHASQHVSPSRSSKRSSGVPSERTVTSPRLSSPSHPNSPSELQSTTREVDAPTMLDDKPSRNSSSLRFRLPRTSSTSSTPHNRSISSRIFRRSSSRVSNAPVTEEPPSVQKKPLSRPRLPRPSSLYGQHPSSSSSSPNLPSSNLQSLLPIGMLTDISKH